MSESRQSTMTTHAADVASGERFEFGKNWSRFLRVLNDDRISFAEKSLCEMLEVRDLQGKSFLDIGSGSGLFSLAARRLGARVFSLDFDPNSVACTQELRRRYFPDSSMWGVEEGSALDTSYIRSLGEFDIVYSWGVLHHTGRMWLGLDNARYPVASGGKLFVAIYNDTGTQATRWKWIKKTYNQLPGPLQPAFALAVSLPSELKDMARVAARGRPWEYFRLWTGYGSSSSARGMSRWYDMLDWVGGYPYEVAKPEEIFEFYKSHGFTLTKLRCGGVGLGCNEFVFQKTS